MAKQANTLIVVTGPTAVGKTGAAIALAQRLGCDIVNADSRQIYRELPIGTAAPTAREQAMACHHFVGTCPVSQPYSAAQFEADVMALLPSLWQRGPWVVMAGGSQMYVDAVCRGIDALPDIDPALREQVKAEWQQHGLEPLLRELEQRDPAYYAQVDRHNPRRIVHAIEICRQAGVPYSSLRTGKAKERPFAVVKLGLNLPRPELFGRINSRVELMMQQGLLAEAQRMLPHRHLNALNTVGYKELFRHLDGEWDLATAVARIQKNTRVYAKKQLTWLQRDPAVRWMAPEQAAALTPGQLAVL